MRVHVLLGVAAVFACLTVPGGAARAAAPAASNHPTRGVTIKVAQFNCDISDEYPIIPASMVANAIRASDADVVGLEEGGGEVRQVADALGWRYYDVRMQIVSRLPLIDPPDGNGVYTYVRVSPGRVVAFENVHLPSDPYGPSWVEQGKTLAQVLALERRARLPAIQAQLAAARRLRAQGMPIFLTGDFNSPSFHDWTTATVGTRPQIRYPVRWPVTAAVENTGFVDSYRAVHPNPVTNPGLTWPTHRTLKGVENFDTDPKDRVDFVFAAGPKAKASKIIGEPGAPGISAAVSPWPSDHRLVVSTFTTRGATPPTLVTVPQRRVIVGDPVPVSFRTPGTAVRVSIERLQHGVGTVVAHRSIGSTSAHAIGTVRFSSAGWAPGAYQAVLRTAHRRALSRFRFWVVVQGAKAFVRTSQSSYAHGQPITVTVGNAPGDRWDWLGVYSRGANPNVAYYLLWVYTKSAIQGRFKLGPAANGPWPLPAGRYSVYLLRDDLYVKIARADFTVR